LLVLLLVVSLPHCHEVLIISLVIIIDIVIFVINAERAFTATAAATASQR